MMARMQGVTEEGFSCDAKCRQELINLAAAENMSDHGKESNAFRTSATEPLILTKLVQSGMSMADIRKQSEVSPAIGNFTSYSGFFTTDAQVTRDNNMFFWYLPAQNGDSDAPLVIWLQGGPGGSSLFGMFIEMGPFNVDSKFNLVPKPYTWNDKYDMLFIDNPVGAGFSYTGTGKGYVVDEDEVANNLYSLLQQFYTVFPSVSKKDLYVTGESYGGHYVPAITYKIHEENKVIEVGDGSDQIAIPLKGFAIGDGWIDPVVQITGYPDLMFNLGLATQNQQTIIKDSCDRSVSYIQEGDMLEAFNVWDEMLNGDVYPYANYFHNITGSNDYDNILRTNPPPSWTPYGDFLNSAPVRKSLHVGDIPYGVNASDCERHLLADFHASMVPRLETLLDSNYKILIYSGQLDVIIAPALTELFLPHVVWSGQKEYQEADRKVWRVNASDQEVAGFVRQVQNLTQIIIRGAGHICPADQPRRSYDMITRFIEDMPYINEPDPTVF
jgi:vitellogenic carboxypeptidase-like protein